MISTSSTLIIISCVSVILSFFSSFCYGAQDELVSVVVIFRHGDRTPIQPYPNDPYKNRSYWPVGFGQLTNTGKKQHLELGRWLRNRYDTFLPKEYSEKDVLVQSTDVDRTLMSAAANLAGIYPPDENQTFDPSLAWQPIPIHTIPEKIDAVLAAKKPCPKYDMLYKQLFKSEYFKNISHKNHDLYAYLTRNTGELVADLQTLEYVYNTLFVESNYNFSLPEWAKKIFPDKFLPSAVLSFTTMTYTKDLARLKVGLLFNELVNYFKNRTLLDSALPKFRIFSAHDVTIANVLNTMGAFDYHCPPYTATVIFEQRRRPNGANYITMFYKNTTEGARQITLENCYTDCDLTDFEDILKPITLNMREWEKECQRAGWLYENWPFNFYLMMGSGLLTAVVIVFAVGLVVWKAKRKDENDYTQLPNEEYA